jgi:hypothetical protein
MSEIYKITSRTSGKSYIGFTLYDSNERWKRHRLIAKGKHKNTYMVFHAAICKYGPDDFDLTILESSSDSLLHKESFWISKYDSIIPNGYNIQTGGAGNDSVLNRKAVELYDLDCNYIRTFSSMAECSRFLGTKSNGVWKSCQNAKEGKGSRVYGHLVCFEGDKPISKDTSYVWKAQRASVKANTGQKRPAHSVFMKDKMKVENDKRKRTELKYNWNHLDGRVFMGNRYELQEIDPTIVVSEMQHVVNKKRGYKRHRGWGLT